MSNYDKNLNKNGANFVPLTPLSFLQRAKDIYPNYEALIYEDRKYTWSEVYKRCIKFASALEKIGIGKGDTVSVLAFNTLEIFEAHYSIPMTGGVLKARTETVSPLPMPIFSNALANLIHLLYTSLQVYFLSS